MYDVFVDIWTAVLSKRVYNLFDRLITLHSSNFGLWKLFDEIDEIEWIFTSNRIHGNYKIPNNNWIHFFGLQSFSIETWIDTMKNFIKIVIIWFQHRCGIAISHESYYIHTHTQRRFGYIVHKSYTQWHILSSLIIAEYQIFHWILCDFLFYWISIHFERNIILIWPRCALGCNEKQDKTWTPMLGKCFRSCNAMQAERFWNVQNIFNKHMKRDPIHR